MITSQPIGSSSLVLQINPSKPNISSSHFSAQSNRVNIKWPVTTMYCASRLRSMPMVVVRAEQVPTTAISQDHEQVNLDDDKRTNSKESNAGGGPNLQIPNIPSWAQWLLGSFVVFFPFYKNLQIEGTII
ncbi:uncharacterized protein LOC144553199 [Carex rostrata]